MVLILLVIRYKLLGLNENILSFTFIVSAGIILLSVSIQKWNALLNPFSLYFIFIFGFGFSLLGLSKYIKPFGLNTNLIICLSILSFSIGSFADIRIKSPFSRFRFSHRSNLLVYYLLFVFGLLAFIYEMTLIGYLPLINIFNFDVYNDVNKKLVSFLHYFVMLFSVIPSWTYILYKRNSVTKRWLVLTLIVSTFILLNFLSRQNIMLLLICLAVTFSFYNKVNYKKVGLYSLAIIGVFFIMGQIRMSQMNLIKSRKNYTPAMFLNNIAGIEYKTSIFESTLTLYSSIRYKTLDDYVKKAKEDEYFGMGKFVLRPFISLSLLDRIGIVNYEIKYNVDSALATYAINPYLDFRYFGVIIFGLLYGMISSHFYRHYKLNSEKYILPWAIIIFCLIMTPFMNYFSSFYIFLIWSLNKLII